jgi:2,3-dihydroxybenzoate-AMP ligase
MIAFSRWPDDLAQHYRKQGYWLDLPLTDLLQRQSQLYPLHTAIICADRSFSYRELDTLSDRLALQLQLRGLSVGDTAIVQLPNIAEFYIVFFALLKIGVAPVNALMNHQRMEILSYAEQLQPSLIIGSAQHPLFSSVDFIQEVKQVAPRLHSVYTLGITEFAEELAPLFQEIEGCSNLSRPFFTRPSPASEVAFFQLSGGSTGTPKLIPRTHNDYYYSVRRSAEICQLDMRTRYLCALPAAHNFLLSSPGGLGVLYAGGTIILALNPEPLGCFDLIQKHAVTMVALVPSAVNLWLQAAPGQREKIVSLKLLQVGGASFAESLARRVPVELGCQLQQVFGMAEGLVNYTRLDDDEENIFNTQGYPMSEDDEVLLRNPEGGLAADGETGLLTTRGPYTFRGYYLAPQHNAQVFDAEGFYCSGDLVQKTKSGYLRVVGRSKDQINRGGEKIASEEVENLLLKHPLVLQAALISMPDEALGEKSCACIVVKVGKIGPVALRKYLREQGIADFKLPDRFHFLESLPLTAVGKTDKQFLRSHLLGHFSPISKREEISN